MYRLVRRKVEDIKDPIMEVPLGDLHAGSGATRWDVVKDMVKNILSVPKSPLDYLHIEKPLQETLRPIQWPSPACLIKYL